MANVYLAPVFAYVALSPLKDEFVRMQDVGKCWNRISGRDSFRSTQP